MPLGLEDRAAAAGAVAPAEKAPPAPSASRAPGGLELDGDVRVREEAVRNVEPGVPAADDLSPPRHVGRPERVRRGVGSGVRGV